jgi:uroporphyrinogen decarboxylase
MTSIEVAAATRDHPTLDNDLLLRAIAREPLSRPPVWMMRQAGRYLEEYREVRARAGSFVALCRNPDLAAAVTVQPVDIVGVDAAIIFSDILVIPDAMGMTLTMNEGEGPRLSEPIRSVEGLRRLRSIDPSTDLEYVMEAIRRTRTLLAGRVPLIGFAGAPWTIAAYMIEGQGTRTFSEAKRLMVTQPELVHALLDHVADAVADHLCAQVDAGAHVVQLFESWGGALAPDEFTTFALPRIARIAQRVRAAGAPLVVFAPGCQWALDTLVDATDASVIGIDWHTPRSVARRFADANEVAIQGNFDPGLLYADPATVATRTREMLRELHGPGYIANLGHGILPDVPRESALAFVRTVREWDAGG